VINAYFFDESFRAEITQELKLKAKDDSIIYAQEGLLVLKGGPVQAVWAQQIWQDVRFLDFTSIKDAAKKLKAEFTPTPARRWVHGSVEHFRRGTLISEELPTVSTASWKFLDAKATLHAKGFCLTSPMTLFCSEDVFPAKAFGQLEFAEDKQAPSRAYLKLWEFVSVYGIRPQPDELCIDLGSSPGGWTWVLASLGCRVLSVDKAPLTEKLQRNPLVTSIKKDAFTLSPLQMCENYGDPAWLFSDIICEPARLYSLLEQWMKIPTVKNFVCSVKFKGQTDLQTLRQLLSIAGSSAHHLFHNKHEVTWYLQR
jgi:23S rRNA (cytidine2498-2'-O)-methyltransferase